jgi:hypothetical protein
MKLSVCLTINDRPIPVLEQVFDSLKNQAHDELVIALDRTPVILADWIIETWKGDPRVAYADLDGPTGWLSPVKAWNAAFAKVTGDVLYCFSSDTVQKEGNVNRARLDLTWFKCGKEEVYPAVIHGSASCSCGPQGQEVNWGGTAPGNLLCDAAHPRPLGFIWAAPASAVKQIGGYDEAFSAGYWHDDDDFFLRLWRTGLDFIFDDSLSGIHLHHDRPVLSTPEGQEAIRKNAEYMTWKHGTLQPLSQVYRITEMKPGRTTWRHL